MDRPDRRLAAVTSGVYAHETSHPSCYGPADASPSDDLLLAIVAALHRSVGAFIASYYTSVGRVEVWGVEVALHHTPSSVLPIAYATNNPP